MREGGLAAQFFAVWAQPRYAPNHLPRALRQIDSLYANVERYPDQIEMARSAPDIRRLHKAGKIAALIGLEGGDSIQDDLAVLDMLYQRGARYMTLTWSYNNNWADSSTDTPRHNGLNAFGRQVVLHMNRLGMMVDISHVSDKTFYDVLEGTTAPVIASHSSCRAIANVPRNMSDEMIQALAANGGVMQINFHEGFLDQAFGDKWLAIRDEVNRDEARLEEEFGSDPGQLAREHRKLQAAKQHLLPRSEMARIADHIDHVRQLVGVNHVGLGSDFDGARMPRGMEGVDQLPALTGELLRRGYSEQNLEKILGGNLLRVMEQVEQVARK